MLVNLLIFSIVWGLYLSFGMLWLFKLIKDKIIIDFNLIGSLMMVIFWPLHLFFYLIRKLSR